MRARWWFGRLDAYRDHSALEAIGESRGHRCTIRLTADCHPAKLWSAAIVLLSSVSIQALQGSSDGRHHARESWPAGQATPRIPRPRPRTLSGRGVSDRLPRGQEAGERP
ncbi:hypothetical protein GCM10023334_009560 [Nonomuraea thailandensis]